MPRQIPSGGWCPNRTSPPYPIHVVAVNYFDSAGIELLVESLREQSDHGWRQTIVDNSQDRGEGDRVKASTATDSRMDVIVAPENLGYFGAARWWYERDDRSGGCEWVVICHADVRFAADFVARLRASDRGQYVRPPRLSPKWMVGKATPS